MFTPPASLTNKHWRETAKFRNVAFFPAVICTNLFSSLRPLIPINATGMYKVLLLKSSSHCGESTFFILCIKFLHLKEKQNGLVAQTKLQ